MVTFCSGSPDSAAAIVTISAPTNAKITITTPARICTIPEGAKPSLLVRFERPGESPPPIPNRKPSAIRMNATIATTLMPANQNSNSPNDFTDVRLIPVSSAISPSAISHSGRSTQRCRISAPATASMARTMAQKYQYSQPVVKPAQPPSERRAYSANEPTCGLATAISPSIRMTSTISTPAIRYEITEAGPVVEITALEPTNRPAPMTPPSEIIVMWRDFRDFWSSGALSSAMWARLPGRPAD